MTRTLRVVVVDDSPFVCRLLTSYLQSAPNVRVIGTALNGCRALELVRDLQPDVVTLDLEMPGLNGLDVLEGIMHETPTPVLIVSGISRQAASKTLQALEKGAVDFLLKYSAGVDPDAEVLRQELVSKVRLAAHIKVIRSLGRRQKKEPETLRRQEPRTAVRLMPAGGALTPGLPAEVVVIGASTGGPVAVQTLLGSLPADFAAAVIVVQHMPAVFTQVFAASLTRNVRLPCVEAAHGDLLRPGAVFVAPGDKHLLIRSDGRLEVIDGPKVRGHRPSIDVTMQSAAQAYGPRSCGVVLTGMGNDGTLGLQAIRLRGGRTYAQDAASCVVRSMPTMALAQGVVDRVGSPAGIARLLSQQENNAHGLPGPGCPAGTGGSLSDRG